MRVYATLLVVVAAVLASSGVVSAATTSGPTKLALASQFESTNTAHVDTNDGRFLRKRIVDESDDVNTEERNVFTDVAKKVKSLLPKQKALKLLSQNVDDLLLKKVSPDKVDKAVARLQRSGATSEDVKKYKAFAANYRDEWFRSPNIHPWQ